MSTLVENIIEYLNDLIRQEQHNILRLQLVRGEEISFVFQVRNQRTQEDRGGGTRLDCHILQLAWTEVIITIGSMAVGSLPHRLYQLLLVPITSAVTFPEINLLENLNGVSAENLLRVTHKD